MPILCFFNRSFTNISTGALPQTPPHFFVLIQKSRQKKSIKSKASPHKAPACPLDFRPARFEAFASFGFCIEQI